MSTKDNSSKENVLFTAINLIKEKGYESVTINEICVTASIAKNTFYYYFESKDDLLLQYYSISYKKCMTNIAAVLKEEIAIEQYWIIVEPILNFIVESGSEVMKHILYAHIDHKMKVFDSSELGYSFSDITSIIIEKMQTSGEMRNTSIPENLMEVMQAQLLGIITLWCTTDGKFNIKDAVRLATETCFDIKPELRKAPEDSLSKIWRTDN